MNKEDVKLLVNVIDELTEEQKEKYSELIKKLELLDKIATLDAEINSLQMELSKI